MPAAGPSERLISRFSSILGSVSRALELFYVLKSEKPAARLVLASGVLPSLRSLCDDIGIFLSVESTPVRSLPSTADPFSTVGVLDDADASSCLLGGSAPSVLHHSPDLRYLCYLSKKPPVGAAQSEPLLSEQARAAERTGDHVELGRLLGYPPCCTAFFAKHFPAARANVSSALPLTLDLVLPALHHSQSGVSDQGHAYPSCMNIFIRSFDRHLISHAPCSFHCPASAHQARLRSVLLEQHAPSLHAQIRELQGHAVLYAEHSGPVLLDGEMLPVHSSVSISPVASAEPAVLRYRIRHLFTPLPNTLSERVRAQLAAGNDVLQVRYVRQRSDHESGASALPQVMMLDEKTSRCGELIQGAVFLSFA